MFGRKVSHWRRGGKFFDNRNLGAKRSYLQCVLSSEWLFTHGQLQFDSGRPGFYYAAILKQPGGVDAKAKLKDVRAILDLEDKLPTLPSLPPPTVATPLAVKDIIIGDEGEDNDRPRVKRRALAIEDREEAVDEKSTTSSSSSGSDGPSGSRKSDTSITGDSVSDDGAYVPNYIVGQRVRVETHTRRGVSDKGLRICCPVHGNKCRSFKSLAKDRGRYGPNAAAMFLSAWCDAAKDLTYEEHRSHRPPHTAIKAYIQSLGH